MKFVVEGSMDAVNWVRLLEEDAGKIHFDGERAQWTRFDSPDHEVTLENVVYQHVRVRLCK